MLNIALELLKIEAVFLKPNNLFTWASGAKAPIYCDNRLTLAHVELREFITQSFTKLIREKYPETEAIAGVATAGIPQASLLAAELRLPLIYVRSVSKSHGRQNLIEGKLAKKSKIILIEDLISTGKSSLAAVNALREAGHELLSLLAIFDYQLPISKENFAKAKLAYHSLDNYPNLSKVALEHGYVEKKDMQILEHWHQEFQIN